jgi:2-dehydro-3-deoxygluconokinase
LPRRSSSRRAGTGGRPAPTVVGIGEALIRLSPHGGDPLEVTPTLAVHVGGAEANVCASLAHQGMRTAWISRLPANPLGRRIAWTIRAHGVDTGGIVWASHGRAAVMFVQPGAGPRAGEVFYYRRDSAFAGIDPDEVDWTALDGARVVHLTGITPALSAGASQLTARAIAEARRRGARVSFDVNYRATLWDPEQARARVEPLLRGLDLIILNDRDAGAVFGARGEPERVARRLRSRFRCAVLVLTLGAAGALAVDAAGTRRQPAYQTEIVDRIGRGDAFVAGFLRGYLTRGTADGLRYGAAMAALKQTYRGDVCLATPEAVEAVLRGDADTFRR